jgi:hypothetical protein
VSEWVTRGKPGLAKVKADQLSMLYLLGHTCQEIRANYPEIPLELILWAKCYYDWDAMREEHRLRLVSNVLNVATQVRVEGIKFISETMAATHANWKKKLARFIANPDEEDAPRFLPDTPHGYLTLINISNALMAPPGQDRPAKPGEVGAFPLVSISVGSGGKLEVSDGKARLEPSPEPEKAAGEVVPAAAREGDSAVKTLLRRKAMASKPQSGGGE